MNQVSFDFLTLEDFQALIKTSKDKINIKRLFEEDSQA